MMLRRHAFSLLIAAGFLLFPLTVFGQVDVYPSNLYKPPAEPYCMTIGVPGGYYETVDFEVYYPSGGPYYWYGVTLDFYGQTYGCIDAGWEEGDYVITAVNFQGSWYQAWAQFTVNAAPTPPPYISVAGAGCDNWDCVWAGGTGFSPDAWVEVRSDDWTHVEYHSGASLALNGTGDWLAFQLTDSYILGRFGWHGLYFRVNNAGGGSNWKWVGVATPQVSSVSPTCQDLYCIQLTGDFPLSTAIDLYANGNQDYIPDGYTNLVVTQNLITFRLNPNARAYFDTTGLDIWPVNTTVANWSGPHHINPVDRAVIGYVDTVYPAGQQYYIYGWACAKTQPTSIDVHVYVGGPAGAGGTMLFGGTANLASEQGVQDACNTGGATYSNYRYNIAIPHAVTQNYGGQPLYLYGISPVGLPNNTPLNNSGVLVPGVDRSITGLIDGLTMQGQNLYLNGWACAKTYAGSIDVHVYLGGSSATGTFGFSGTANQASGPGIASACNSTGTNYRFSMQVPQSVLNQFPGQRIYVHGISPYSGLDNLLIGNSGRFKIPDTPSASLKEYIYLGGRVIAVESTTP